MTYPNEMNKLIALLAKADIPFEVRAIDIPLTRDGDVRCSLQVHCPDVANSRIDAICHCGSYGHTNGLLETMSDLRPDVDGYLTANEAFQFFDDVWQDELYRQAEAQNWGEVND